MKGIAASPGIEIGKAYLKVKRNFEITNKTISETRIGEEISRLNEAIDLAKRELYEIKEKTACKLGEEKAEVFAAHIMLLEDPELIPAIKREIENNQLPAEAAVEKVINRYALLFTEMEDEYLQNREADIRDVGRRLLEILVGRESGLQDIREKVIIIADEITPSDTAQLDINKVIAFATESGSNTSHTAIFARSLGIPAVVGAGEGLLQEIEDGDRIIVDGNNGRVLIRPDRETLDKYREKQKQYQKEKDRLNYYVSKKAVTADGEEVDVLANIGNLNDLEGVLTNGGEGIGLFRTEFLYMGRKNLPSEEEQLEVYREVAEKMGNRPVTIRTLDIGGDKDLPYLDCSDETNPFLGYRAIRLSLDNHQLFKPQLKAILRASNHGNIKLMYPMISSVAEIKEAKQLLDEVKRELREEGKEYDPEIEVGIMIEIPAAVMIAEVLAEEVDFFSIGTNDLIQYTLGVDRTNERIADLYSPYHPAVLRLIKKTIDVGHRKGISVAMCGEAAGNQNLLPFFLGAGLDEFSMSSISILPIKELLSKWTRKEAAEIVKRVLTLENAGEIRELLTSL